MSSANTADYRRKAKECFARAGTTRDAEARAYWLALAEDWQSLAEHVEKSEARSAKYLESGRDA
jgi:hypothetical protein